MISESDAPRKICTTCGVEFPATTEHFHRSSSGKYGLTAKCRSCRNAAKAIYNETHRAERQDYYNKHKEEESIRKRISYSKHKEEYRVRRSSPTERERARQYYRDNRERILSRQSKYLHTSEGRIASNTRTLRRRAKRKALPLSFTATDLHRAYEYWGGLCPCCGKQVRDLFGEVEPHADHWIPLTSPDCPGTVPWNMVILCSRCNRSKSNREPKEWLIERFGKRQAIRISRKINEYLEQYLSTDNVG